MFYSASHLLTATIQCQTGEHILSWNTIIVFKECDAFTCLTCDVFFFRYFWFLSNVKSWYVCLLSWAGIDSESILYGICQTDRKHINTCMHRLKMQLHFNLLAKPGDAPDTYGLQTSDRLNTVVIIMFWLLFTSTLSKYIWRSYINLAQIQF